MFVGFLEGGLREEICERLVRGACSHGSFQIFLEIGKEARPQLTAGREAQSVAVLTKVVAHGTDKPDLSCCPFKTKIFRGAVHLGLGEGDQLTQCAQAGFDFR